MSGAGAMGISMYSPGVPVTTDHTITDDGTGSGNGAATYQLDNTGVASGLCDWSASPGAYSGEWLATLSGPPSNFDAFVTNSGNSLTSGSSALSSWLNLNTTRSWSVGSNTNALHTATLSVSIRRTDNGVTLATATITLNATGDSTIHTCVTADSWLSSLIQAYRVEPDMVFNTFDVKVGFTHRRVKKTGKMSLVKCVKLVTEGGATLRCSNTTPFDLRPGTGFGRPIYAPKMLDHEVLVSKNGAIQWEKVISVEDIGEHFVIPIDFGGFSFAAGDDPHNMIFNHNKTIP